MGRYIVKLKDFYLEWSTIVDAPITDGMTRKQFENYYCKEYGTEGMRGLPARMARVEAKGTSSPNDDSAVATIWLNRAGPGESTLTIEGIYRHYCLREEIQPEWIVPGRVMGGDEDDADELRYETIVKGWEEAL